MSVSFPASTAGFGLGGMMAAIAWNWGHSVGVEGQKELQANKE